jgi:hypothetical protein
MTARSSRRVARLALLFCLIGGLAGLAGCGGDNKDKDRAAIKVLPQAAQKGAPREATEGHGVDAAKGDGSVRFGADEAAAGRPADGLKRKPAAEAPPATPRKIIYTGHVDLVVEDFEQAEASLRLLIKDHKGYVARSEVKGEANRRRAGTWTVRIPSAQGEEFRDAVVKLGEPIRSTLDSEDITDQYYDTQAARENLEAREKALRTLYEKTIANARLADLLAVDRELTQVRGEINTLKGRLQRWDKQVAFTTFTITIQERRDYVPPTAPAFGTTVGRTFSGSVDALVEVGKALVLVAVALAPWLPVILAVVAGLWLLIRRLSRSVPPPPRRVVVAEVVPEPPAAPPG